MSRPVRTRRFPPRRDGEHLLDARRLADRGDDDGAEAVFLELLEQQRGSGSPEESAACSSLVTLYGRQERLFEAVTLAGQLRELGANEPRDAGALAYAAFARATCWLGLGAREAAEVELERLATSAPEVAGVRGVFLTRGLHGLRVRSALERQELDAAHEHMARYEATLSTAPVGDSDRALHGLRKAGIRALEGSLSKALDVLEQTEPYAVVVQDRARLQLARVDLLVRDRRPTDEIIASAVRLQAQLDAAMQMHHASQLAWDASRRTLELVGDTDGNDSLFERAWDLLTTAIVRRSQELRRAVERLPEIGASSDEDRQRFRAIRERGRHWRVAWRSSLRARFEGLRSPPPPASGELLSVCAWCDAVHMGQNRWVPFLDGFDLVGLVRVTHGICPPCEPLLRTDAGSRLGPRDGS